ncbi:MAG: hypothetical protein V9G29_19430 [Burkholderiaceae bacterium]
MRSLLSSGVSASASRDSQDRHRVLRERGALADDVLVDLVRDVARHVDGTASLPCRTRAVAREPASASNERPISEPSLRETSEAIASRKASGTRARAAQVEESSTLSRVVVTVASGSCSRAASMAAMAW